MVLLRLGYRSGMPAGDWAVRAGEAVGRIRGLMEPACEREHMDVVDVSSSGVGLRDVRFESASLAARLEGCTACTVFLATLGPRVDEAIDSLARTPSMQALLDAAASEAAEACARWIQRREAELALPAGARTVHRFSPGYGDFSLDYQRWFTGRFPSLGVRVEASGMMVPRKTVSGVIGWRLC